MEEAAACRHLANHAEPAVVCMPAPVRVQHSIVFRGDQRFCRQRIIHYCERAGVHYSMGP